MNASERTAGAEKNGSKRARASRKDASEKDGASATNDASEIRADVAGVAATLAEDAMEDDDERTLDLSVHDEDSMASDADPSAGDDDAIVRARDPVQDAAEDPVQDPSHDAGAPPAAESAAFSAGNELSDDELLQAVSALVFASPEPLSERRLVALLDGPEPARVTAALDTLKTRLVESRLPLVLVAIAGGWQIVTVQEMAETVQRLFKTRKAERVSPAALETLAVVAYRQPVTKADIEAIRGVQVGPILRTLVDRGFIRVTGRAEVPGHPLQYGTTRQFLERFGLSAIEDLPRDSELAKG